MNRWKSAVGSIGVITAALLAAAAPAMGATDERPTRVAVADSTGDVWSSTDTGKEAGNYLPTGSVPTVDVTRSVVAHRRTSVVVRSRVVDLKRVHTQQLAAFIHTPDAVLIAVTSTEPGHRIGRHALIDYTDGSVRCPGMTHNFDYTTDQVTLRVPRSCLGRPRWVSASVMNTLYKEVDGAVTELTDNPHNATSTPGETRRLYHAH